jgi:hypothetical protein
MEVNRLCEEETRMDQGQLRNVMLVMYTCNHGSAKRYSETTSGGLNPTLGTRRGRGAPLR